MHSAKNGGLGNSTTVVFCIADSAVIPDSLTAFDVHVAHGPTSPTTGSGGNHTFGAAVGATSDTGSGLTTVVNGERV